MLVRDNSEDLRWQLGSSHGSCYLIVTHKETVARRTLFVKGAWAGRHTNQDAQQSGRGLRRGVAWRKQKRRIEQQRNVGAQSSNSLELHFVSNMMQ